MAGLVLCLPAAGASAQGTLVQQAASCLAVNPVCVEPGANPSLTKTQAAALRRRVEAENAGPLYIAILPPRALDQARGSADQLLRELAGDVRREGTYVVVADRHLRAASTGSEGFSGARLATAAVKAHGSQGLDAILNDLVDRVAQARQRNQGAGSTGGGSGGGAVTVIVLFAVIAALVGVFTLYRRRSRKRQEAQQLAEVKQAAREDLLALGDDIRALDLDVEMPGVDPAIKENYAKAVELYDRANQAFDRARRPQDLGGCHVRARGRPIRDG